MKNTTVLRPFFGAIFALSMLCVVPGWSISQSALAGVTDIAKSPIFSAAAPMSEVKPNVMFVLDDSGSMSDRNMPDDAANFAGKPGYASSQCNGLYYNPAKTYALPVDSTGATLAAPTFTSAWDNGYKTSSGSTNLSSSFKANSQDTGAPAYYYTYSGAQTSTNAVTAAKLKDYSNTSSTFYKECNSPNTNTTATITVAVSSSTTVSSVKVGTLELMSGTTSASSSNNTVASRIAASINSGTSGYTASNSSGVVTITQPASAGLAVFTPVVTSNPAATSTSFVVASQVSPFTKVVVGASEQQNFANWYSYYSTRILMMKTSAGLAFKTLDNHFRVGFMTINGVRSADFLNIGDFGATQKANWYTALYGITPGPSTPLREALASIGQIYAGKLSTYSSVAVTNPVQYACQQNYTILSTDGYWNGTDGAAKKLDGNSMDNQDGPLPRPYNDGATTTTTIVTPYTTTKDRTTVTSGATTTNTFGRSTSTVGTGTCSAAGPVVAPANTSNTLITVDSTTLSSGSAHTAGLGLANSNPDTTTSHCVQLGGSNAWFCRGSGGNTPVVTSTSVTDSSNTTWYLVTSGAGTTGCVSAHAAFESASGTNYSTTKGVCPSVAGPTVPGKIVTTTPYTQVETLSGSVTTVVDHMVATQTTTQVNSPGVTGPVGALTPTTPTYVFSSNASTVTTPPTSDTYGAWVAGTPNPNGACVPMASVPQSGTTAISLISSVPTNGTAASPTYSTPVGPTMGVPVSTPSSAGGTSDTLADVAAYYYKNSLRSTALNNCSGMAADGITTTDLCLQNLVPPSGLDTATWQHMTTFTLGLGARGRMVFDPNYLNATSGDYYDVWQGKLAGTTTNCTWRDSLTVTGGPCNWPVPGQNNVENIDDLWHAAVNGHGNYFSAADAQGLADALSSSLNVIINAPQPGTAAAAATTNPKITKSNNFQFSSYFKSVEWTGELIKQTIDLTTGTVPPYNHAKAPITDPVVAAATYTWSAQGLLDANTYTARTIFTNTGTMTAPVKTPFVWGSLSGTLQAYFTKPYVTTGATYPRPINGLSQFCVTGSTCIPTSAQNNTTVANSGAAGEALVNFLRGDRSNEEGVVNNPNKYFRNRTHVLGDIVSAQPQYVAAPNMSYADAGYADYKLAQANRTAMVYAAANDGMLHAFDASSGQEQWAYIPSFVLPRLYTLADKAYSSNHQYFVEGTPRAGDVYINNAWHTILVGGLDGGGTGYYALDITNPASPSILWEFTDANMGFTFGNPEITKLDTGTWVVLFASGYNNCPRSASADCTQNGTGDGVGRLYVLNAGTGVSVTNTPISTGVGSTATTTSTTTPSGPSGLARIVAQAAADNVTTHVYGGDLYGNLWRFTIGSTGYAVQLLATFKDALGNFQPITARPQVTTYNGLPLVYVGTGRYLGVSDVEPATGTLYQQTFYAIKDTLGATSYGNPRANTTAFVSKTAMAGTCPNGTSVDVCQPGTAIRTLTQNTGVSTDSLNTKSGWFVDFPATSGELAFTDPKLAGGTLGFSTNVPMNAASAACGSGTDSSNDYMMDYLTGNAVGTTTGIVGVALGAGIATTPQIAQLPDGSVVGKFRLSDGTEITKKWRFGSSANGTKRVSWRELVSE